MPRLDRPVAVEIQSDSTRSRLIQALKSLGQETVIDGPSIALDVGLSDPDQSHRCMATTGELA